MKKRRLFILLPTIGACVLSLLVLLRLFGFDENEREVTAKGGGEYKTFLLAGVDEAGENTDMLMLCSVNSGEGCVRFLQIPRDTYYRTEKGGGKINRIFRANASKYGKKRAADELTKEISRALSIPIDGYIIFDGETVESLVELVGGVPVNVPFTITYTDKKTGKERVIEEGERHLNGEEAVAFLRHRKSYAEGDLGRLDAQMRFLSGVSEVLPSLKKIDSILTIYQKILPNLLTNLTEKDIMEFMIAYFKNRGSYSVSLMRLPGEACYTDGAWYYVLYRAAAEKMLRTELGLSGRFDPEKRFTDEKKLTLSNIYFSPDHVYRVFTPEEVKNKKILHS